MEPEPNNPYRSGTALTKLSVDALALRRSCSPARVLGALRSILPVEKFRGKLVMSAVMRRYCSSTTKKPLTLHCCLQAIWP